MIDELSKELKQTDSIYVNRILTEGVLGDIICKPLDKLKIVLLLCNEVLFRVSSDILLRYFTTSNSVKM